MKLHAHTVLHNGKIATMDASNRFVQAIAIRDAHVVAIGNDTDIALLVGDDTEVIDLKGATAIPGIIDSHCHPDSYAARIANWHELSPKNISSRAQLLQTIRSACAALGPDKWFAGYRFNENKSGGYPTIAELDEASGNHPLFILRTDGHLGLANTAAFKACAIPDDAPDPEFGRFDRHPVNHRFTGLVRETAAHMFLEAIHANDTVDDVAKGLEQVFEEFLSHGVTSVYNSLTGHTGLQAYQRMRERGTLTLRVGIIVSGREQGLVESFIQSGIRSGFGDDWVRIIGVEWCPDCSTSGRTAAYYEPYQGVAVEGEPQGNNGMLLYSLEDLSDRALAAHRAGLLVMVEGVGDRGIDFALDVIEHALQHEPRADHRMRVEHCCYVTPTQQRRLLNLGVVDSSATGFMYELGDAYLANRGSDAMQWMWPHRTLIDAGIPAPGHSDAWVCSPNPFTALWAMVNRKTDTGKSLDNSQAVTPMEALHAYTTLGAYSGKEEHRKGKLLPGMLADIAVLDRDYFTVDPDQIRDIRVLRTLVGGETRYRRAEE